MEKEEVKKIKDWMNTEEYKEKNFNRKAIVINPARACQPLGAVLCAAGFEDTMPFVHGSHGCVAYYRNNLSRHFREPLAAVCTSLTEDGAVFGGQANAFDGFKNALTLYKPKMLAISTTCMTEVIGDDLGSIVGGAREKGYLPEDILAPYANTPSFAGSHLEGYDSMLNAIIETLCAKSDVNENKSDTINIIPGFDTTTGNINEIKRILKIFGVSHLVLADYSNTLDYPLNGEYKLYPKGATKLEDVKKCMNNRATIVLQRFSAKKTAATLSKKFNHEVRVVKSPIGINYTDEFLMVVSELSGKEIPGEIEDERGRAIDSMTDAQQYIHGKKFAIFGDPDMLVGLTSYLLEMGGIPKYVLCSNGTEEFKKEIEDLFASYSEGEGEVYINKDLWHLRSLIMTGPVDMLMGPSHGKFAARDAKIPHIRIGYPIFDRVNIHRYPLYGYSGVINLTTWIVNKFMDILDDESDDAHFELMR
ncbi:nitrogenase molybdenum-iron protein subunit beta [Candidatus Acidulodesulfobacterium sp. H_13]|uniref:nitrogenase molybdenum-iron protein subunit beta n=1 Tax=Candidatus Acidulodesulfobacterium sp. H_13 TaxID=3395470 RepID=UPI003AF96E7E